MNPLLTVIPYHAEDSKLVVQLLEWLKILHPHGIKDRYVLLACDYVHEGPEKALAKEVFRGGVWNLVADIPKNRQGWPTAPNYMFEEVCNRVRRNTKFPFLWLEPDCVPIKESWFTKIEEEYAVSPQKFMGSLIDGKAPDGTALKHMSGVGVYPNDCMAELGLGPGEIARLEEAFDVAIGSKVVFRMRNTKLIQHHWGRPSVTFVEKRNLTDAANVVDPSLLKPETLLFHGVKDGSLIDLLKPAPAPVKQGLPPRIPVGA